MPPITRSASNAKAPANPLRRRRQRLHTLDASLWACDIPSKGSDVSTCESVDSPAPDNATTTDTTSTTTDDAEIPADEATAADATSSPPPAMPPLPVAESPGCAVCGIECTSLEAQRSHFRSDWHKYNVQRRARGSSVVSEDAFDALSDLGSHSSLSGSDSDDSEHDPDQVPDPVAAASPAPSAHAITASAAPVARHAERLEFRSMSEGKPFIVVYKVSLPDQSTLASLSACGPWAVVMTGGGHFSAAIWDADGNMKHHKTFHRYTSRSKQGGSQAAADAARGNARYVSVTRVSRPSLFTPTFSYERL